MVELRFDGKRYSYWQKVSISESVDDMSATVRLSITRPGTGESLGLSASTVVEVLIDGLLVATVRPDMVRRSVDANSHTISIDARSLARELVDSQYSVTLSGLKLGEIANKLCGAFKVPVKIVGDTAVVPDFAMQSEAPANALINAARASNMLLHPSPDGGLVLTPPTNAAPVATLIYGVHIKRYDVVDEFKLRHSEYWVKGYDYQNDAAINGKVKDDGITHYRPMQIVADRYGQGQGGSDRRALLERNRRLARAHRIELDVVGWTHAGGLWAINTQVRVIIPEEGIDGVFLIGERSFTQDDHNGTTTQLQVMHRQAFEGDAKKTGKKGVSKKRVKK